MILVTLGTNPYPFKRLLHQITKFAEKTGEHVIVQSGNTPVDNQHIESFPFICHSSLLELMSQADVVVTHGGFGSLQDCIGLGVKTVAVPRSYQLDESLDDQNEITAALAAENLIIPLYDVARLEEAIEAAKALDIKSVNNYELSQHIARTIESLLGK